MKWRHVAFRVNDDGLERQSIHIDLSRVKQIGESKREQRKAEIHMLNELGLEYHGESSNKQT
jgi:hypothetical protein